MYKVLVRFNDGENGKRWPLDQGGHSYAPGDEYPKEGFEPSAAHIEYLIGNGNRFKKPVIEQVEDGDRDLAEMTKSQLIAFAATNDIDLGEAKNKVEILAAIEDALKE